MFPPNSPLGIYARLKESGSTSDFPYVLSTSMYKKLLKYFRGVKSGWSQYCLTDEVNDFKAHDRVITGELEDLKEIAPGGGYQDSKIREDRYQVQVKTFGREFSLLRQVMINDDLRAFADFGMKAGRAANRSLAKAVVHDIIYDNATAYDGVALFHDTGHANSFDNLGSTSLAGSLSVANTIQDNLEQFMQAKDEDGELIGISFDQYPALLVHPVALSGEAQQVCQEKVTDTSNNVLVPNPIYGRVKPVVEPFLDEKSTSQWYLFVDPRVLPAVEVNFLRGKREPDLLYQVSQFQNVRGGGTDPYAWFDIDEIRYRIRWDYGTKAAFYQAAYKHAA